MVVICFVAAAITMVVATVAIGMVVIMVTHDDSLAEKSDHTIRLVNGVVA